ncbi:hypothetical protein Lfu02_63360 [Longispora fulva]|uniref:non-specific serine/threonine protein kinase n=1 Tax=Longispora fulva TaxID=619741 RepID=A0A8J7GF72_9ACTN|nr:serine/threonine-protein kinase [Longispora fulva]MBG6134753.1 serine/threonine protein kinase [Longispora fulva]GIG61964.1 hypothetical protein Lfu02_63360 [Longispora fulva]
MVEGARIVGGRYSLGEHIAAGGMGVVWRAEDLRLGRVVAVKELLLRGGLDDAATSEAKRRAIREARIAARLHHPNAVTIFDVVEDSGQPWLVMEYVPSQNLTAVLAERGPLPPVEVASIGRQLASALAAAHDAGIVHRDIKPGNVLVTEQGTVKITDFGISRAVGDATITAASIISGTPAYLAPEVARGADADHPSDVFSLGATLYSAVEGIPPFGTDGNLIALLHRVAGGVMRPPTQAGILTPLLLDMLHRNPAARPTMVRTGDRLAVLMATHRPLTTKARPVPVAPLAPTARLATPVPPPPPAATAPAPAVQAGPESAPDFAAQPPAAAPLSVPTLAPTSAPASNRDLDPVTAPASGDLVESSGPEDAPVPTPTDLDSPHPSIALAPADVSPSGSTPAMTSTPTDDAERLVPPPGSASAGRLVAAPPGTRTKAADVGARNAVPRTPRPPRRTRILVAAGLALVAAVGLVAFLANRDDTPGSPNSQPTFFSSADTPSRSATTSPTTVPTPSASPESVPVTPARAIADYYALMPGNSQAGYARLSDRFKQDRAPSFGEYQGFWSQMRTVTATEVTAVGDSSVSALITYTSATGQTSQERHVYGLVKAGGQWLIDSQRMA